MTNRCYVRVEEAVDMPGLRIAFSAHVPGPWGEAARAMFDIKRIPYVPVLQVPGAPNEALQAWTGQSAAPVAVYEKERPRCQWSELIMLADRLGPELRLVPQDENLRADMFGLCHELCAEDGFGWNVRVLLFGAMEGKFPLDLMRMKYTDATTSIDHACKRCNDIIDLLARRLTAQASKGSGYLVGNALSAADIYWVTFSNLVRPMPHEACPMPDFYRELGETCAASLGRVVPEIVIEHRDRILRDHFVLPMWF